MRRICIVPVVLASVLAVAGCSWPFDAADHQNTAVKSPPASRSARSPGGAQAKGKSTPQSQAAAQPTEASSNDKCSGGSGEAPKLVGMDEAALQRMLGSPAAVTQTSPGKTWHYRNQCCELSVALYPNLQTHSYRVLSYEVISDDSSDRGKRSCLADFPRFASNGESEKR